MTTLPSPRPLLRNAMRTTSLFCSALALAFSVHAAAPKVIKKVPPEFPREAAQQSISSGVVKAKLSIDADGKVSAVEIIEAEPRRVFDKAVSRALMEWRFEPSGEKQTHEVKLVFKNED
ncbi:energy transducer TonB [Roseateles koreensis]|uniref:Energy transducer TonB n=1 Tax=Roseateles koreensis TaxID=2987526 RepID=A0ABT5KRE8_9BURK|nr:energy transducer TonB [Roseateles koreensis]MDC8785427.1 energy transducer TonB [Roseateles koreensis]